MPLDPEVSFREYCLQHFRELRHTYGGSARVIDPPDLEASLDILESVLAATPSPSQLRGLETQFYSAFQAYLTLPRTALGDLLIAVDRLSSLVEPFLKKIAFHFLSGRAVTKKTTAGDRQVPLYRTSNYVDILEGLGIVSVSGLYKDQDSFWRSQPADTAILRKGFTSRQQGTHEARIHTLCEMEEAAYFIIGQYVVICLHLLHDPSVARQVDSLTERTRVLYLLREKVRAFSLTGTLLSQREHVLLYKYRAHVVPEPREKKYLFLNQLAGRGPSGYWLTKDKQLTLEWAR